mmetsp:Transcript_165010/g.292121  ORF Transcript_165010/g.292121 Transcript_165010/m.292121 type:complete len:557 (+) Transcript_165010:70-1740(+)
MLEGISLSWPYIVLIAYMVPECISLLAKWLQRTKIGSELPVDLQNIYDAEEYKTSNAYTLAKSNLGFVSAVYALAIFLTFWFAGGFGWLDEVLVRLKLPEVLTGVLYVFALPIGMTILSLPFAIYSTFVLEERFGFNKTTPWTFVKDRLKGLVLAALLGGPLLALILWLLEELGKYGWLYVFIVVTVFQLVMLFLTPILILPVFMEMIPLPGGLAFTTEELDKKEKEKMQAESSESPSTDFLYCRVFYGGDTECNGKPCWVTKDRRFKGSSSGAHLCIHWAEDAKCWAISDGTPDNLGTQYALSDSAESPADARDSTFQWRLCVDGAAQTDQLLPKTVKFARTDTGSLRTKLLELADRTGYKGASIFVIDGSSRSSHSNAFCMGFGKFRRICLFDTLLPTMTEQEIVAVLGHEIGHDRLYHVHKMLVVQILHTFVMFFALGQFLISPVIAEAFFVAKPKVYIGFVLFSIVWEVVDFFISIPMVISQRFNEYDADRFSVECDVSYAQELKEALKKLMKRSKANLTPHWFAVFLTYSHPPLDLRMQAIDKVYQNTWKK